MKFKLLITIVVVFTSLSGFAQQEKDSVTKRQLLENWHFGGGLNLGFGSNYTTIGVSPVAMYEISDKVGAGVGLNYMYSKWRHQDVSYNIFGAGTFVQYHPIRQIQLMSEFEYNHVVKNYVGDKSSYNVPALYIGAGYTIGRFGAVGVKYDLLWDEHKSIYAEPFVPYFRIYF